MIGVLAAFLILVMVPMVSLPQASRCPPYSSCPFVTNQSFYGSIAYYALGVGGRLFGSQYQFAYLPGWDCHQTTSQATVTYPNGTSKDVSMPSTDCVEHVITIS